MKKLTVVTASLLFTAPILAPTLAEDLPLNPAVTQATISGTICKPGWTKAVRPPLRVTDQIKRDKLRAAGWTDADKNRFELDYIIPLSLGGAPDDPKNFQLEPGNEVVEKEALEACLPRLVCERRLIVSFLGSKPSSSDEERLEPFFSHRLTP
jgi:hypothetical protein